MLDDAKTTDLWGYVPRSIYRWANSTTGDVIADEILMELRTYGEQTRSQISALFSRQKSAEVIGNALFVLLQAGLAGCRREKTGGRPVEIWWAVDNGREG